MENFIIQYASICSECKLLSTDSLTKSGCQDFSPWRPSKLGRQQSVQASLGSVQPQGRWMDQITSESPFWPYYYSTVLSLTERTVTTESLFVDTVIAGYIAFLLLIAGIPGKQEETKLKGANRFRQNAGVNLPDIGTLCEDNNPHIQCGTLHPMSYSRRVPCTLHCITLLPVCLSSLPS